MIDQNEKNITNSEILDQVQVDNQVILGNVSDKAKKIYLEEIIKPFIEFL